MKFNPKGIIKFGNTCIFINVNFSKYANVLHLVFCILYKYVIVLFSGRGGAGLARRATNPNDM